MRRTLKYCTTCIILHIAITNAASAQQGVATFTLPQCIEMALSSNVQIKQKEWQTEIDKANWGQSKGNMLPTLNGEVFHGLKQGRSIDPYTNGYVNKALTSAYYNVGSNITLWNGGSLAHMADQNKLAYQAGQLDMEQLRDNITISVVIAYFQVLNNEELLSQAKDQSEVTEKEVERLQLMLSNGAVAPSVLHDLKGQLANDQLNEVDIKNGLEMAKANLCQLISVDYGPSIKVKELDDLPIPGNNSEISAHTMDDVVSNAPAVKASYLRMESAKERTRSAIGSRMPSLYFLGSLGTNYSSAATFVSAANTMDAPTGSYILSGSERSIVYEPQTKYTFSKIAYRDQWQNNFNSLVGIGLQVPIVNGLQAKRKIELARINERQEMVLSNNIRIQYRQAVHLAYINLRSARERYILLTSQVNDLNASFQAAEARFNNGSGTTVDYITAKNNADRAASRLITARYDLVLRKKILDVYLAKH